MGKAALIYAIRPDGPDVDMKKLEEDIRKISYFETLEKKPFIYGMDQIVATFILDDKDPKSDPDSIEKTLSETEGVSSIEQLALTLI
ncbi:TPA: hypothetical protein H1008_02300 [archaeon]|nr:hypothetical protein [Candidatus Undinarchaeales archaeon SRR5007147.bin71]